MSAAGLIVEYLFRGLGIEPTHRPDVVAPTEFSWNDTTFLNIVFLVVLAGLWWLARNQRRLGGGEGYRDRSRLRKAGGGRERARSIRARWAGRLLLLGPLPSSLRGG